MQTTYSTLAEMISLRGKQVRVYTVLPGHEKYPDGVCVAGVLHMVNEEGEFDVMDDTGVMQYCWPALRMELLPYE